MFKFILLVLFAGGWALAASALHVVRTPANIATVTVIPKNALSFDDTYVDTRQWTMQEVPQHAALVRRLIESGNSDVLAHVADLKSSRDVPTQLSEAIQNAPATAATPAADKSPSAAVIKLAVAQLKAGKMSADDLALMVSGSR